MFLTEFSLFWNWIPCDIRIRCLKFFSIVLQVTLQLEEYVFVYVYQQSFSKCKYVQCEGTIVLSEQNKIIVWQ